jgi:ankyrin repeat protein
MSTDTSTSKPNILLQLCSDCNWKQLLKIIPTVSETILQYSDSSENTCLHYATSYTCPVEVAQAMIDRGISVNVPTKYKSTPLHWACNSHGSPDLVQLLLSHGADCNVANCDRLTPLLYAVTDNAPASIIQILLEAGADPNLTNKNNQNAIEIAKAKNNQDIINVLSNWPPPKSATFFT